MEKMVPKKGDQKYKGKGKRGGGINKKKKKFFREG